mgnify:CR=1 FL=1
MEKMIGFGKGVIIAIMLSLVSLTVSAQIKALEKYSDTKGVTYVYISKAMLRLAGEFATPSVKDADMSSIMSKMDAVQIVTSDDKDAASELKRDAENIVKSYDYEILMQVDDEGDKVRIYHHEGKQQSAIIMLTTSDMEVVVMAFTGKFTLSDVKSIVRKTKDKNIQYKKVTK